jgi:formiminotetrahydrofolate cyclodeaminase
VEIEAYLETLASAAPTPGGGSAATIVGALGAALIAMVARITAENPSYAAHAAEARSIVADADTLRAGLGRARATDERAYGAVVVAMALTKATPEEKSARTARLQAALAGAAAAPLEVAELALEVVRLAQRADALGNRHLASDVACAAIFGRAALAASAQNVRINHAFLKDPELIAAQEAALHALELAATTRDTGGGSL